MYRKRASEREREGERGREREREMEKEERAREMVGGRSLPTSIFLYTNS